MRIRDSDMPESDYWESLFDAEQIAESFGWNVNATSGFRHAIEFGCGYGTFTKQLVRCGIAKIDVIDMEPEMIEHTRNHIDRSFSQDSGFDQSRVKYHLMDFVSDALPAHTFGADLAVLFHVMHLHEPMSFLKKIATQLTKNATLAILHWRSDRVTPRGPAMDTRPTPEHVSSWATQLGALPPVPIQLTGSEHHYGAVIQLP